MKKKKICDYKNQLHLYSSPIPIHLNVSATRFVYTRCIDITYNVYNTMCINYYNCLFAIFLFLVASSSVYFLVVALVSVLSVVCVRVCFHFRGDLYYLLSLGRVFFFSQLAYGNPYARKVRQTDRQVNWYLNPAKPKRLGEAHVRAGKEI